MYINEFIQSLSSQYKVSERNLGEFARVKKSGMNFEIHGYEIEGVGKMSTLSMKAMLGLMKMETLIVSPMEVDAPLYSFDWVRAMGNDTLIIELYDTQLAPCDLGGLDAEKAKAAALPDNDLGQHWYDHLASSKPSFTPTSRRRACATSSIWCRRASTTDSSSTASSPAL